MKGCEIGSPQASSMPPEDLNQAPRATPGWQGSSRSASGAGIAGILVLVCLMVSPVAFGQFIPNYWISTPGARLFMEGSAHYERGNHRTAYSRFHYAALWADKRAQFNLGVMNVSGQVLDMPPDTGLPCVASGQPMACGWAWLELSAEREYPQFRRTADEVWSRMNEGQRRAGRQILAESLLPRYGDEARVELTALRMNSRRMRDHGISRVGFDHYDGLQGGPAWEFEQIVAYETRLYHALENARVELGEFELIDDDDEDGRSGTDADGADGKPGKKNF